MKGILDGRQLLAFTTLARTRSFTLAARELFVSQSAISHTIKTLEDILSCQLFERSGRNIALTGAGKRLLGHADRIVAEMVAARVAMSSISRAPIRLGAMTSTCQIILPTVLPEFKHRYPDCPITVSPGTGAEQAAMLYNGQTDLALMLEPMNDHTLSFDPLFMEEIRFIFSPDHHWALWKRIMREEVENERLLFFSRSSLNFRRIAEHLRADGITLNHGIETQSVETIRDLAKLGVGVGVLGTGLVRNELQAGSLLSFQLGNRPLMRQWGIGHLPGRQLSAEEKFLASLCKAAAEKFVEENAGKIDPVGV